MGNNRKISSTAKASRFYWQAIAFVITMTNSTAKKKKLIACAFNNILCYQV